MKMQEIIAPEDLREPYDRLAGILDIADIVRLEGAYRGVQIKFRRGCRDARGEYPELAAAVGAEKAAKVVRELGGMWIYFPGLGHCCADKIRALVARDFNGYNYRELARKYGYTERHVRRIVKGQAKGGREEQEGQMELGDFYG